MPGAGRVPSGNRARERDNKTAVKLVIDGKKRGVNLPQLRDPETNKVVRWHPRTVAWWNSWRTSPQAAHMMTSPDWDYLLDTALLHHTVWSERKLEMLSELRLRLAKFGVTPEDRARLGVEISTSLPGSSSDSPPATASRARGNVTEIDDRRARLTS
jgi:hypothetical protein